MHATRPLLLSLSLNSVTIHPFVSMISLPFLSFVLSLSLVPQSLTAGDYYTHRRNLSPPISLCLSAVFPLSLTRSPSCAFAVLFPPTHSAPSLLLFRAVFSWVDVIGIYRTLPERERERELTYTAEWKTDSSIHQSKHTALHRSNQDQHNRSEPSTTQHNGANKHSANDITPEQTSTKQYMQANKDNTEQTNMILHKKQKTTT